LICRVDVQSHFLFSPLDFVFRTASFFSKVGHFGV
jgi:hypothetical protein